MNFKYFDMKTPIKPMTKKESCETLKKLELSRQIDPVVEEGLILQNYEVYGILVGNTNVRIVPSLKKENFDNITRVPNIPPGEYINAIGNVYKFDKSGYLKSTETSILIMKLIHAA